MTRAENVPTTLLPCPLCGGSYAQLQSELTHSDDGQAFLLNWVECQNCFCSTGKTLGPAHCLEQWQLRPE